LHYLGSGSLILDTVMDQLVYWIQVTSAALHILVVDIGVWHSHDVPFCTFVGTDGHPHRSCSGY